MTIIESAIETLKEKKLLIPVILTFIGIILIDLILILNYLIRGIIK